MIYIFNCLFASSGANLSYFRVLEEACCYIRLFKILIATLTSPPICTERNALPRLGHCCS